MAFTKTARKRQILGDGRYRESGIWVADSGTTSGNIAPEAASDGFSTTVEFTNFMASSDTDGTALFWDMATGTAQADMDFAANDTGIYMLEGKSV